MAKRFISDLPSIFISVNSCLPTDIRNRAVCVQHWFVRFIEGVFIFTRGTHWGKCQMCFICTSSKRRRTASVRVNRRLSSRSWCCLHSVTASLDKRRVHAEKLWAISLSSTLWTLLSMVWQRSSAWRAEHISSTASPQQDLFYDRVNKARVWRPKAEAKGTVEQTICICLHTCPFTESVHMSILNLHLHLCERYI